MTSPAAGTLYGVGVGPGDPELLTRKAIRILASVQAIYAPATAEGASSLAGRIIADLHLPTERLRPVHLAMTRDRQTDEQTYEQIAQRIHEEVRAGHSVAWITEGDPLLYSTFVPIYERLRHRDIAIEIVAGITSYQAAAARAGIPLARLGQTVAIVPAAYGLEHLPQQIAQQDTVVLLKIHRVFDRLLDLLARLPVRVCYVENVGGPGERIVQDPWSLRGRRVPYFSLLIVQRTVPSRDPQGAGSTGPTRSLTVAARKDPPAGALFIVGLGPGARELLTPQAEQAIAHSQVIVGYEGYFAGLEDLTAGKECLALGLSQERQRARLAAERAIAGQRVCVISSGDAGIYGMASLVLETLDGATPPLEVVVVPGVSAVQAAAALLGAPLGHDFAVISLSDLLTPWPVIARRLRAAAEGDFVVALLNPRSQRRTWQLEEARRILLEQRHPNTPAGIVRQAYRPEQTVTLTTLAALDAGLVDMFTTVIVGNSTTRQRGSTLVTPRGYLAEPAGEGAS